MIQRFFLITTVGVLIGGAIGCGGQKAATPIRVLIVTGGHEFERDPFFNMFDHMAGGPAPECGGDVLPGKERRL